MTILPTISIAPVKGGVAARATQLALTAHGANADEATHRIARAVGIFARALAKRGDAGKALSRLGVDWTSDGDGFVVDPRVIRVQD